MSQNVLQSWKGKITETFKNLTGPLDPHEKRISELVERATSDLLAGPDWGLNMEVVDVVNSSPE